MSNGTSIDVWKSNNRGQKDRYLFAFYEILDNQRVFRPIVSVPYWLRRSFGGKR